MNQCLTLKDGMQVGLGICIVISAAWIIGWVLFFVVNVFWGDKQ